MHFRYTDMSTEFFIARRIYKGDKKNNKRVSSPAIKIAIAGIALGLAVMLVSVCIIVGFKKEIREKVIGFGSHIQISSLGGSDLEGDAIVLSDSLKLALLAHPEVNHVQEFISKPGIIKTEDDFLGVVFKGVNDGYEWSFFKKNMLEGLVIGEDSTIEGNQVIISKIIADKLHLAIGDKFVAYFVQEPVRARQFYISGIYETNFEDYDKLFVVSESNVLAQLNGWGDDMYSGAELLVENYKHLDETAYSLFCDLSRHKDRLGNTLYVKSIKDINPMIFNWLSLLDLNVWVILILMVLVSGFTMISGLLIIILERTNMIGILKAVGANDLTVRKVFLYLSVFLIGQGMIWGNIIALTFCLLQKHFQIIKLNPSTYYLSSVPIDMNIWYLLFVNVGALAVSLLMMLGPSYLVAKITPSKSIKFE